MSDGWVKIHRVLFEHPIWKQSTPEQKVILIALIGMVNHEPERWEWKGEMFEAKRGQTVTSLESIREACGKGVSIQNVRTALARFEKLDFLTNESTKSGRLITICNYCKWQDSSDETNKGANKEVTKSSQRPNKDLTPNKNDKNDKNDKKDIYSDVPAEIKDAFMEWAEMRKSIKKPIMSKATVTRALNTLYKLSKRTDVQIQIINKSTDMCWQSFYPLKAEDAKPKAYKEFEKEPEYEAEEMPQELRDKLSGMFTAPQ